MDLAGLIGLLFQFLTFALIGRVILSWINVGPSNPIYPITRFVYQITEPILAPIRRVLPTFGMLDLSPMVAIILMAFIQSLLRRLLS